MAKKTLAFIVEIKCTKEDEITAEIVKGAVEGSDTILMICANDPDIKVMMLEQRVG